MSAFICSDNHINSIVRFACEQGVATYSVNPALRWSVAGREQETAELLRAENVRSVNYRYLQDDPDVGINYNPFAPDLRAIEVIKACDCLAYQSCEHPEWDSSLACSLLKVIQRKAIDLLPGYSNAQWEIAA